MSLAEQSRPTRSRIDAEERLIVAAGELLGEVGPRSMSVRNVAERAGVNHGLVHHYFGGKDGLLQAAMTRLVQEHAVFAKEASHGDPIPAPLLLNHDPKYLRAVVRAVLDDEMQLATTEISEGVSVPQGAMAHATKTKNIDEPDVQMKAMVAVAMAMEMGWAALEPFLFAVTEVADAEQEDVRDIVRNFRRQMVKQILQ
jgi:AcrR family transcriptional regulator